MFIIELTYRVTLEEVDKHIDAHVNYLNEQYELGNFIASGRKVPRNGGIILSNIPDKNNLLKVLEKDPFKKLTLADYKIIEFITSKTSKELEYLLN